jgi:hypothetical protein
MAQRFILRLTVHTDGKPENRAPAVPPESNDARRFLPSMAIIIRFALD